MTTTTGDVEFSTDSTEIKVLKRVVWRTAVGGRVERFAALLDDPEKEAVFGDEFVKQLSAKIGKLFHLSILLAGIYTVLMLSLFAAQDPNRTEFQFLGYSFKNLGYYKEFLLLAAALVSPISSTVVAYHRYLGQLRQVALRKMFPDRDVLEFAEHLYSDKYFDPLVKDHKLGSRQAHGVSTAFLAVFGIALFASLLTVFFASLALQIIVIYDVATKPSSTPVLNTALVAFSIAAIALSWLIGALQLPLPEVDYEGHLKLAELKEQDFEKYQEAMKRIAAESQRRERQWTTAFGAGAFALTYAFCWAVWGAQFGSWQAFGKAILGLGLMAAIAPSVATGVSRAIYRPYFRKYPGGTADTELEAFKRATRRVGLCRVLAFLGLSFVLALLMLNAE